MEGFSAFLLEAHKKILPKTVKFSEYSSGVPFQPVVSLFMQG